MILVLASSVLAATSIVYVQRKFDEADERAALSVVQQYRSAAGRSIPDVLAERHPGAVVSYTSEVQSACFQHIRVHAMVEGGTPAGRDYVFVVDINGPAIHPGGPEGESLLSALDRPATEVK